MQALVYWLVYPILWLISILPFPLFYKVSDMIYGLVFYIVRYRRKTVTNNLRLVFPDKPESEIKRIEKAFYKHMCDMFLEMIKSISITEKQISARYEFMNLEYLRKLEAENKSLIVMCGHYASYEWVNGLQLHGLKFESFGVYKKIKNKKFDELVGKIRKRFGGTLITSHRATETIVKNEEEGNLANYFLISDQSPKMSRAKYWLHFMGIRVPAFEGSERLARKLDISVVYLNVEKVGRGYYQATLIPITEDSQNEPEHFITTKFFELLENQIRKKPEHYLWTHKRWKHRNEPIPNNATIIN